MKTTKSKKSVALSHKLAALIPLPNCLLVRSALRWDGAGWEVLTQVALQKSVTRLYTECGMKNVPTPPAIRPEDDIRETGASGITYRPAGVMGQWSEWELSDIAWQKPTCLEDLPALMKYHGIPTE